ncbi:hypothetical protein GEMRC1_010862 [Eukaryota sp. GEM-RC1]
MLDTSNTLRQVDQALELLADLEEEFEASSEDVHHKAAVEFLKEVIVFLSQQITASTEEIDTLKAEVNTQQSVISSLNDFLGTGFDNALRHEIVTQNPAYSANIINNKLRNTRQQLQNAQELVRKSGLCEQKTAEDLADSHRKISLLNTVIEQKDQLIFDLKTRIDELSQKVIDFPLLASLSDDSRSLFKSNKAGDGKDSDLSNGKVQNLLKSQENELSYLRKLVNDNGSVSENVHQIVHDHHNNLRLNQKLTRDNELLKNSLTRCNHRLSETQKMLNFIENGVENAISFGQSVLIENNYEPVIDSDTSPCFRIRQVIDCFSKCFSTQQQKLANCLQNFKKLQKLRAKEKDAHSKQIASEATNAQISSLKSSVSFKNHQINSLKEQVTALKKELLELSHSIKTVNIPEEVQPEPESQPLRSQPERAAQNSHSKLIDSLRVKIRHLQRYLTDSRSLVQEKQSIIDDLETRVDDFLKDKDSKGMTGVMVQTGESVVPGSITSINFDLVQDIFQNIGVPFTESVFVHHSVTDLLIFINNQIKNLPNFQTCTCMDSTGETSHEFLSLLVEKLVEIDEVLIDLPISQEETAGITIGVSQIFNILKDFIHESCGSILDSSAFLKTKIEIMNSFENNFGISR